MKVSFLSSMNFKKVNYSKKLFSIYYLTTYSTIHLTTDWTPKHNTLNGSRPSSQLNLNLSKPLNIYKRPGGKFLRVPGPQGC